MKKDNILILLLLASITLQQADSNKCQGPLALSLDINNFETGTEILMQDPTPSRKKIHKDLKHILFF